MTLVARTPAPQRGVTSHEHPKQVCVCADPQVERLRDLIAQGWDQFAASKLLWGDGGTPRPTPAHVAAQAAAPAVQAPTSTSPGARFPWRRRSGRAPA